MKVFMEKNGVSTKAWSCSRTSNFFCKFYVWARAIQMGNATFTVAFLAFIMCDTVLDLYLQKNALYYKIHLKQLRGLLLPGSFHYYSVLLSFFLKNQEWKVLRNGFLCGLLPKRISNHTATGTMIVWDLEQKTEMQNTLLYMSMKLCSWSVSLFTSCHWSEDMSERFTYSLSHVRFLLPFWWSKEACIELSTNKIISRRHSLFLHGKGKMIFRFTSENFQEPSDDVNVPQIT